MIATLVLLAHSGSLFLSGGGTTDPAIVVLPLAAEKPDDASQIFLKEHGATDTRLFAKAAPTDEDRADLKRELDEAKGVWMPGGVQGRFISG